MGFFYYFFPRILLIMKIIKTIIAITAKAPTPIPALKIPAMASQLVSEKDTIKATSIVVNLIFMILCF